MGRALTVVPGVRCRLSNIDDEGRWRKTESYRVGQKTIVRRAGASAGNAMKAWRDLRLKRPELFADVSIMQQPAAVVDSVITAWSLQELSMEYPRSTRQRADVEVSRWRPRRPCHSTARSLRGLQAR